MVDSELAEAAGVREKSAPAGLALTPFFHLTMTAINAVLLAVAVVCLVFFKYRLEAPNFDDYAGVVALGIATGYCWWAKFEQFFRTCQVVAWSFITQKLLAYPIYLAARSRVPLRDVTLAHFDHEIGLEVTAVLNLVAHHPGVRTFFSVTYDLLFPMMVLGVMLPAITYRWTAVKELIIATTVATVVGAIMFAWCPAVGPWVVYHYAPSAQQQTCAALFLSLRTNSVHILAADDTGIVCFPSFHVLLAILSCIGFCSIRPLRIPAIVLAACVVVSTLTTGWHYVTDVMGGLSLAAFSILAAKGFTRMEARVAAGRLPIYGR
jgi:membrane-associated phospholipid phosphatase